MNNTSTQPHGQKTIWSKEKVLELLEEEDFAYQNIELPYGLSSGGQDRSPTARSIFPDDLNGKTVLDIGSFTGYFCFEALKRGASRTLGLESNSERVRQSRLLADCLNVPAEFEVSDVENVKLQREWDYVLCLNVLHHMHNPLALLDKLVGATREKVAFEVATLGRHDLPKLGISPLVAPFLKRAPILLVGDPFVGKSREIFITPSGLKNLLLRHRLISNVEIMPSQHKGRFIAVASRRRLRRMLVVTGPTAAGKSTLIEKIQRGEMPDIDQRVGWGKLASWPMVGAGRFDSKATSAQNLIFHYDMTRPNVLNKTSYESDDALELFDCADEICILTIGASNSTLKQRLQGPEKARRMKERGFLGAKYHLKNRLYDDPQTIVTLYKNWFEYTRNYIQRNSNTAKIRELVIFEDNQRFMTPAQWSDELNTIN